MSHTPYYYAPGGKYVLFLDLLGFTAFVHSSFQKKGIPPYISHARYRPHWEW
jgi:hypothetical protein